MYVCVIQKRKIPIRFIFTHSHSPGDYGQRRKDRIGKWLCEWGCFSPSFGIIHNNRNGTVQWDALENLEKERMLLLVNIIRWIFEFFCFFLSCFCWIVWDVSEVVNEIKSIQEWEERLSPFFTDSRSLSLIGFLSCVTRSSLLSLLSWEMKWRRYRVYTFIFFVSHEEGGIREIYILYNTVLR